jgi:hypothetical protein
MVAEHHAQAVSTTASLVAQAQACAYHQVALRDLASLLPEQDEGSVPDVDVWNPTPLISNPL